MLSTTYVKPQDVVQPLSDHNFYITAVHNLQFAKICGIFHFNKHDKYQKPHVLVAKLFTIFTYKDLLRVLRY